MRTRSTSDASHGSAAKPFFSVQRAVEPAFFSQSAFAGQSETETATAEADPSAAFHSVQRKCACEAEKRVLPQLEIGPVNDPLETEADMMADRVVRRQAAGTGDDNRGAGPQTVQRKCACEDEKKILPQRNDEEREAPLLQAKADDGESVESAPDGLETGIAHASGSGAPLASHTRDEMEDAFDADFSGVRVHTGAASASMNEDIGARAFTYGTDIHFNAGEFAPGTERGARLLAHELTHVVQQNGGVRRAPKRVQRKQLLFGPRSGMPSGSTVHNQTVMPLFEKPGINEGLWVEPWVPGANGRMVGRGFKGKPDLFRDNAHDGRPIGINESLVSKGFTSLNQSFATPRPPSTSGGTVRDLDRAPEDIEIGDVKPALSGEEHLGRDQISRYVRGIKNTAKAVNDYQAANNLAGRTWDPKPRPMSTLTVPTKIAKPARTGAAFGPLSVWQWLGTWKYYASTSMEGSLVVYKSSVSGIWAYEWVPLSVPEATGDDPHLKKLYDRLQDQVKPKLHGHKKAAPKLKGARAAAPQRARRQAVRRFLRRKAKAQDKFDEQGWLKAYNPWKTEAEEAFADPKTRHNEGVLEALMESKKRTGIDPGIPEAVTARAQHAGTIRHWVRYGGLYGWLRKTFDSVWVKLSGFAQKVKDKIKKLVKSGPGGGFGNWIKAAALALFKVAKKLGAWAISMIVDRLLDSLQEGVINIIQKIADAVVPEGVKSAIEEIEEQKNKFEEMIADGQESLEKKLFGDKLEFFEKLNTVMDIVNTISTIVDLVRWGIRLVACASPPLVGCLWNLAIAALEWAFSKLMETCWFSKKVHEWIVDTGVQAIIDFPTNVAKFIAEKLNDLIKLPGDLGPLFAPIEINHREFKMNCEEGGGDGDEGSGGYSGPEPTEEQKALMDVAQQVGFDKFDAFIEMTAKRAAGYNVMLDAERIRKIAGFLKDVDIATLKKLAENQPVDGVPVPVEEFLKSIATLTPAEVERKEARKIDYDKAKRSNTSYQKKIGWKPEKFVEHGVAPDSTEFADAIYDIQKMLGITPDGMAGPYTTKTFYERNKQPKDGAYTKAVDIIKRAEEARAEAEAGRKALEEFLSDEKVQAALKEPFPSEDQLKRDLTPLTWANLGDDQQQYIVVDGRPIVAVKTDAGHRFGAYFHYVEQEFNGVKMPRVVKVSRAYALDDIAEGEYVDFKTYDKEHNVGIELNHMSAQKKDSFFKMDPVFLFARFIAW